MSIKIDPETDKAIDPESIGSDNLKRGITAVVVVAILSVVYYLLK